MEEIISKKMLENYLPHRGRAIRIDEAIYDPERPSEIVATKEIQPDDPDLEGHFPGNPMYMGNLQLECACLAAAVFILKTRPHIKGFTLIRGYGYVGLKNAVKPGDKLTITATFTKEIKKDLVFLFDAKIINQEGKIVAIINDLRGAVG